MLVISLIGIVIVAAIWLYRRYWPPGKGKGAATGDDDQVVPTFRVVSLGTSGAGKTVLLASMFRELAFAKQGRPYQLDTDGITYNNLAGIYAQTIDTTGSWPAATRIGQETEYTFACVASDDEVKHHLFDISYLDYAGELFMPSQVDEDVAKLDEHVSHAHALFGVLDGRRLAEFLRGDPAGNTYMNGEILSMIGRLSKATCPIHLVITKWDLVHGIGETDPSDESRLTIVREALLDHGPISGLVTSARNHRRTVRLIPVSAVGDGFARIDKNGVVVKIAGAHAESQNLEVPFATVVPDYLGQLEKEMSKRDREAIRAKGGLVDEIRGGVHSAWKSLRGAATALIAVYVPNPGAAVAVNSVTDLIARWIGKSPTERAIGKNKEPDRELDSLARAQDAVLDSFVKSVWMLEAQAPSSVLAGGFST